MLFQVSFPPVEVRCQSCLCPNKLMTLQMVNQDTWIHKGGYRQFRGEWVSPKKPKQSFVIFHTWVGILWAVLVVCTKVDFPRKLGTLLKNCIKNVSINPPFQSPLPYHFVQFLLHLALVNQKHLLTLRIKILIDLHCHSCNYFQH